MVDFAFSSDDAGPIYLSIYVCIYIYIIIIVMIIIIIYIYIYIYILLLITIGLGVVRASRGHVHDLVRLRDPRWEAQVSIVVRV